MTRKTIILVMLAGLFIPSLTWAVQQPVTAQSQTLTLEQCLELAYANNQELKSASQSVLIAKENVKKAEGAFLPSLDYQFNATKLSDPTSGIIPYKPINNDLNNGYSVMPFEGPDEGYAASLSATYPLYTGGKLQNTLKIAKTQLDLATEQERIIKQKLTYNVKSAYNQVWLAEEKLLVANAAYENMKKHAERIEKMYSVGNTSKFELLRAQVNRDNLKPNVIKAQNGVAMAKLSLATLIGLQKDTSFKIAFDPDKVTLPENYDGSLDITLNLAYQNRSELKQLQLTTKITEIQLAMAQSYLKPNVALIGSYEGKGGELDPGSWEKSWNLILNVKGNLYNGTNKPQVNVANAELERIKIQEEKTKEDIRQEVEQVLLAIKESLETAKSAQANIVLAKESLRLTEVRFQAGMATTIDVMDAQLAQDQALTEYYSSVASYLNALAKLDLVTGKN